MIYTGSDELPMLSPTGPEIAISVLGLVHGVPVRAARYRAKRAAVAGPS